MRDIKDIGDKRDKRDKRDVATNILCPYYPLLFLLSPPKYKALTLLESTPITLLSTNWYLSCAEDSVTSIAQAGEDVILLVEALIERREVDIYVGVLLLDSCHALG